VQCLDPSGRPVPWWFIAKFPDGFHYAYKDSSDSSNSLKMMSDGLDAATSALGRTLTQVYSNKGGVSHLAYNDELPASKRVVQEPLGGAHAKGVVAAQGATGFWLVHSVPKFPNFNAASYTWTGASHIYGQSFLCLSLDSTGLDAVGYQLSYFHPDLYATQIASQYRNLTSLVNGVRYIGASIKEISVLSGPVVTSFAKSNTWGKDVYEDLVCPHYRQGFYWETWRRPPVLPTYCTPQYAYDSINVNHVSFGSTSYSYTKDHSKWGVSMKGNLACVGGINRMSSQRERGGGTVCLNNAPLWNSLTAIIADHDAC